nr:receptor-type tyrosine-protein phosphatase eta-like [Lytechinus pictus]
MGDDSVTLIHGGESATFNFSVSPEVDPIIPREGNRVDLTGLQPGVIYNFSVNVVDEAQEASVLLRLPPSIPLVSVGATTETSITLNIKTSSGTADTYSIKIASTNPGFCLFEDERSLEFFESGDHVIDDLPPGLEYTIEVTGVVAAVTDEGGDVVLEMTSGPEADVSGSTDPVPRGEFLVIDEGEANVTLAWFSNTTSNLTVTNMTRAQSMTDFILSETDCSSPRVMDFELSDPGTVYTIVYSAISGEEFEYRIRTDPGDLENFTISYGNQTSIELSLEPPIVGDVDRVDITIVSQVDRRYNSPGQTISVENIQASFVLDNLLPSVLYEFSIRTVLNATDEFEEQQSGSLKDDRSTDLRPIPRTGHPRLRTSDNRGQGLQTSQAKT